MQNILKAYLIFSNSILSVGFFRQDSC